MSETNQGEQGAFAQTNEVAIRAAKRGAKVAASTKASKVCVAAVRKALGKDYPEFFKSGVGKQMEPFAASYLIQLLAVAFGDRLPYADKVRAVAEYAMEGTSRDALEPLIERLEPLVSSFVGVSLPAVEE